jgi:hypothetical protein
MRETLLRGSFPSVGQVMFRREDIVQFDSALRASEDFEWWIRMRDRAIFAWSPEVGHVVRQHPGRSFDIDHELRRWCRLQVLQRHLGSLDRSY